MLFKGERSIAFDIQGLDAVQSIKDGSEKSGSRSACNYVGETGRIAS